MKIRLVITATKVSVAWFALLLALAPGSRAAVSNVAYWRMGENDAGAVNGAVTNKTEDNRLYLGDSLNLTLNARYTNDVAAVATSRVGSTLGLRFNTGQFGWSFKLDYTNNFGLEFWVRPDAIDTTQCLALNGNSGLNGWGIYLVGGQYQALLGGVVLFGDAPAVAGDWTHLALVRDNGTNVFYVNGVPNATNTSVPNPPTASFAVGAPSQSLTSENFAGSLDEVRVFSFAPGGFSTNDLLYYSPAFFLEPVAPPHLWLGSATWADYDNDGRQDFFITGYDGGDAVSELWRNTGSGFSNVTASVAPGLPGVAYSSAAWGDYDNDGRLDLLIAGRQVNLSGPPTTQLWHNTANGFTNVPIPGLQAITGGTVAWGDYDNDGRQDFVVIGNMGASSVPQLWRNTGNGFTNVANVFASSPLVDERTRAIFADFDKNGWLDLLIAGNTFTRHWLNNNGVFTQTGGGSPFLPGFFHGAIPAGDYDSDGWLDVLLTGSLGSTNPVANTNITFILRNLGTQFNPQRFSPVSPPVLPGYGYSPAAWGDYDNDGQLDFLISGMTNNNTFERAAQLWRKVGTNFIDVTGAEVPGLTPSSLGSMAWADFNNDGRLDFLYTGSFASWPSTQLWRNNGSLPNTPPTAPAGLTATPVTNGIMLAWSPALDAQTPTASLTYNVRIGITPGGVQILSPASATNGWRRVTALGNTQTRTNALITRLLPGTYYWSVQAVDNGYAGGAFATEASFTVAPRLDIATSGTNVTISWSASLPDWVLQETPALSPAAWINSPSGTNNPATIPATNAAKFYRLIKP